MNPAPFTRHAPRFVSVLLLAFAGLASSASAQVVYRETFGATATDTTLATVGWLSYHGATATAGADTLVLSSATGAPTGLENVGQAQASLSDSTGFAFFGSGAPANVTTGLLYTTEYNGATPLTTSTLTGISLYQGQNADGATFRFALRVDGSWYAGAALNGTNIGGAANFASLSTQLSVSDFESQNWFALTLTPDSALSVSGTAVFLPTGSIDAFGVYFTKAAATNIVRLDSFEVAAIPEPSSAALLIGAGAVAFAASRRRTRAALR